MSNLDIGVLNSDRNYFGLVDSTDPFDLYKFSLNSPAKVGVSLTGLTANADLEVLDTGEGVLYNSANGDLSDEAIAIDNLAAGNYTIRVTQVSGEANYNLNLTVENIQVDPLTGLKIESGYFTVGETGQVGVDFINDGGWYKGELAIFSLEGMDRFVPGSEEFIKEAAHRSLSNSNLGYIVISDPNEAAKFNVGLANADNNGEYKGIKTFAMKPEDKFGVMLVPNGKVQEVWDNPNIGGSKRPLFSLVTANPNAAFHVGQVADINGTGSAFAIEDMRVDTGTDKDYNDVIFKLTGATGKAVNLDDVINPERDWRDSKLGKDLIDYVKKEELAIDPKPPIDTTPVDPTPPIDSTPIDPKPPIDSTPIDPKPPIDSTPVDPKPPIDTTPVDPTPPIDSTPVDPTPPIDSTPVDPTPPIDTTPVDPKPPIDITPVDPTPPIDPTPVDPTPIYNAGNTLATARDLGTLRVNASEVSYSLGVRDFVNNVDRYDYYRFNFEDTNNFNVRLDDLSADAKVELIQDLNNNDRVDEGEVLEISDGGTAAQIINRNPLNKGIYYVRVSPGEAGDTNYSLSLTASLPEVSIAPNQPLIGIIDTGFSGNNADLDYRRFKLGSDRISNDNDPLLSPGEGNEHGTHILGLIAATQGNGIGIDGINDKAPIWLGRAVGSGNWAESLIEFVDAAKQSGQKNAVVNLSLDLTQVNPDGSVTTRYELTPKEREAIEFARQNHVLIVTAAGNDGGVMSVLGQASQEFDNIITVGASNEFDRADYSSYGAGLDILTEGGTIDQPVTSTVGNSLGKMTGTSVAAAKVTGVASLIWAANPDLNFKQVISILESTTTDLKTSGWDGETGFGLLNSAGAVELAKNTIGENYTPEAWVAPLIWDGEGKVTPTERAAQGGISIATAPQFSPAFSDNDKVDSTTPEKYYQFTVSQPGYVRWTLTRTNGSNEFPGATLVKADGTPGRFKFVSGGAATSVSVEGQTPPISRTDGVFVDPGTYYLRLRNGTTNTVKNYNLSNEFIADSVNTFPTPVNYSTTPYFDFEPDIQSKALSGNTATQLNVSGQVEYKLGDVSNYIAKYGFEVKESGKLKLNLLSPNGKAKLSVEKFIGFEDQTVELANYRINANSTQQLEINLNKGRYQIEVTPPFEVWNEADYIDGQTLKRPYTLTGVFSRLAPKPGEGNVPIAAGDFIKTVTSNGVDTHYYNNGYLSVQPKGLATWYTYGTGKPISGVTTTAIVIEIPADPDGNGSIATATVIPNPNLANGNVSQYPKPWSYASQGTSIGGSNDLNDFYTFNLAEFNWVDLQLKGLNAKAGFELIKDSNNNRKVDDGEIIASAISQDGITATPMRTRLLEAGNYYVRVFPEGTGTLTNYNLNLSPTPTDIDGNGTLFTAGKGKVYSEAFRSSIEIGDKLQTGGSGSVGGADIRDYYVFNLNQEKDVELKFYGASTSANFNLIQDKNNNGYVDPGEVLASGNQTQPINYNLQPGTYYAEVFTGWMSANTDYSLSLVQDAPYRTAINKEYPNFSGLLGNPTGDFWQATKSPTGTTGYGRSYEHGTIHWSPQYGAVALWHGFQNTYNQNGGSGGWLGFPTKDKYDWEGGQRIDFEGGYMFWKPNRAGVKAYRPWESANVQPIANVWNQKIEQGDFVLKTISPKIGQEKLIPMQGKFNWSDADGDAITKVRFYDRSTLGDFVGPLGSVVKQIDGYSVIEADANKLNDVYFSVRQLGNTSVSVSVFDGQVWSDRKDFTITTYANKPPVVNAWNLSLKQGQSLSMQGNFSSSDPDGDPIKFYAFYEDSPVGSFTASGQGNWYEPNGTVFVVPEKNLNTVRFVGEKVGNSSASIKVHDGKVWSQWKNFNISVQSNNKPPVVTTKNLTVTEGQSIPMQGNFSYSDPDGNSTITKFQFFESTPVADFTGNFRRIDNSTIEVDAKNLNSVRLLGVQPGSASSTSSSIRAFDGQVWSAWKNFGITTLAKNSGSNPGGNTTIISPGHITSTINFDLKNQSIWSGGQGSSIGGSISNKYNPEWSFGLVKTSLEAGYTFSAFASAGTFGVNIPTTFDINWQPNPGGKSVAVNFSSKLNSGLSLETLFGLDLSAKLNLAAELSTEFPWPWSGWNQKTRFEASGGLDLQSVMKAAKSPVVLDLSLEAKEKNNNNSNSIEVKDEAFQAIDIINTLALIPATSAAAIPIRDAGILGASLGANIQQKSKFDITGFEIDYDGQKNGNELILPFNGSGILNVPIPDWLKAGQEFKFTPTIKPITQFQSFFNLGGKTELSLNSKKLFESAVANLPIPDWLKEQAKEALPGVSLKYSVETPYLQVWKGKIFNPFDFTSAYKLSEINVKIG
ncbi:S8 family serine peptidase [Aerosakkonema sp. BLCC-F183]|uniref:S8 family serine peptidase n=1 Tax=Aerosakkonema sp. BLCC-F183 TaxID=3342834 RepID=UPI0035BB5820